VFYNGKLQKLQESQISVEESISTERSGKKVSETVSHVVRTYVHYNTLKTMYHVSS